MLILEGTRLRPAPVPDPGVPPVPEDRAGGRRGARHRTLLAAMPGRLGVILLTPENGERVEAIAAAMAASGRLLVLEPLVLAFAEAGLGRPLAPPHAIYAGATSETALDGISFSEREQPRLTAADIAASPGNYLLQLSFSHFAELLDIRPACRGGAILSCNGPPLGRFHPAWSALEWWAANLGLQIVVAGCTGHAAPHDLALIAGHSRASTVMSIHSRHPELMPIAPERLLLPERGRAYDLAAMP